MENKKKGINDPKFLELHSHGKITMWVGELVLAGFKYIHIKKGGGGRRGRMGKKKLTR